MFWLSIIKKNKNLINFQYVFIAKNEADINNIAKYYYYNI